MIGANSLSRCESQDSYCDAAWLLSATT
jgi:hypothetical protein